MVLNVKSVKKLMKNMELDIVVYPEYALTSSTEVLTFVNYDQFSQEVPKNFFEPCRGNSLYWSVLEHISCIAYEFKTYLAVNLLTR